jgi:hypothetical protein
MSLENKRDTSRFLVYFAEFPGIYFNSKSGGTVERAITQRQSAGMPGKPVNVAGRTTVGQITLTKDYDAIRDFPLELWSKQWALGIEVELTLVVQPVTAMGIPEGAADMYNGCALVSLQKPDTDRQGGGVAELTIVVQPTHMTA